MENILKKLINLVTSYRIPMGMLKFYEKFFFWKTEAHWPMGYLSTMVDICELYTMQKTPCKNVNPLKSYAEKFENAIWFV